MTMTPTTLLQVPLFPLHAVLLPGGALPLHIFEVRYLDMIGRCHKAGDPFGVVCLSEGGEVSRPAPGPTGDAFAQEVFLPVGTLARITKLERPQPGLMMINCVGTQRFRVLRSEKLKYGLWVADIELLADDAAVPVPDDLLLTRDALQGLVQNIAKNIENRGEPGVEMLMRPPYFWDDCSWLANRWCELLPMKPEHKHRLMALDSPVLRLELVADTLNQLGFTQGSRPNK